MSRPERHFDSNLSFTHIDLSRASTLRLVLANSKISAMKHCLQGVKESMCAKKHTLTSNLVPLSKNEIEILKQTVLAGYSGDSDLIQSSYSHACGRIRAAAINAGVKTGQFEAETLNQALSDPSIEVRLAAARAAIKTPDIDLLAHLVNEKELIVAEAIIFALGERKDVAAHSELCRISISHKDALCREAAVAALANLEMVESLETLILAASDKAQVRRRVAIALAYFDDPRATECLTMLSKDRDWQTRKIAQELLDIEYGQAPE